MTLARLPYKPLIAGAMICLTTFQALGDDKYPDIYPYVPIDSNYISERIKILSEDENAVLNFYDIVDKKLTKGKSKQKPWTSTYWPLNQGLVANPYADNIFKAYNPFRLFSWTFNHKKLVKRQDKVHKNIDELTNEELDRLAPSEKYDLLLGDKDFDLTNRLVDYMQRWGSKKEFGNLTRLDKVGGGAYQYALNLMDQNGQSFDDVWPQAQGYLGGLTEKFATDLVEQGKYNSIANALGEGKRIALSQENNYVLEEKNSYMATWEGICHGWSLASGNMPRPRKIVTFNLEDGRKLRFFPEDIKGLLSLLWANSVIQDARWFNDKGQAQGGGVLMEGLRCNQKNPAKDKWGRLYDDAPDAYSGKLEPRCVGVHPALWHLALTNVIGKQGRSFVVERKVKAAVDNHPLYKYEFEYFNPYTGKYSDNINEVIERINDKDVFRKFRSNKAKKIVGVMTTMRYLDWARPTREETDHEDDDAETDIVMLYDLELDEEGNIVGGQWRSVKDGTPRIVRGPRKTPGRKGDTLNHRQPDFFWLVTKNWKPYFQETPGLSTWKDKTTTPPQDWTAAASDAHSFEYQETHAFGIYRKCNVFHKDTGERVSVPCEFKINKPQPLMNVMNVLMERSK